MVHIPEIRSVNAVCPSCKTKFGYVVDNNTVTCPVCRYPQPLPIIQIGTDEYLCIPCRVSFTATDNGPVVCPQCETPVAWKVET